MFLEGLSSVDELLRPDGLSWFDSFTGPTKKKHIYDKIEEMWGPEARHKLLCYMAGQRWKKRKIKAENYPIKEGEDLVALDEPMPGVQHTAVVPYSAISEEMAALFAHGVRMKEISKIYKRPLTEVKLRINSARELTAGRLNFVRKIVYTRALTLETGILFRKLLDEEQIARMSLPNILKAIQQSSSVLERIFAQEERSPRDSRIINVSPEQEAEFDESHQAFLALKKKRKKDGRKGKRDIQAESGMPSPGGGSGEETFYEE